MKNKETIEEQKYLFYFQEKVNDVLDLQDDYSIEEIGMFMILKATYFKTKGILPVEKLCQLAKFFGDRSKIYDLAKRIFTLKDDFFVSEKWNSEINNIIDVSKARREAAKNRWEKKNNPTPKEPKKDVDRSLILQQTNQFESLWEYYLPVKTKDGFIQKGSKQKAELAFKKAIKKTSFDNIMKALESYLKYCSENQRFTKNVSSWLNEANFEEIEENFIISEKPNKKPSSETIFNHINSNY